MASQTARREKMSSSAEAAGQTHPRSVQSKSTGELENKSAYRRGGRALVLAGAPPLSEFAAFSSNAQNVGITRK